MPSLQGQRTLSIEWLQDQYAKHMLTPEDVVLEIIARSKKDNEMNIWITPPEMDRIKPYLIQLGEMDFTKKPLWGVPFAMKDNVDLTGVPTTAGCPQYSYKPDESAVVVERLLQAGAIPLGKTNMDQFATGLVGTRSPYGETQNAINQELISGGSSSGSAVAVARGLAAFALGTDTAGSGRVPAAINRIVGFKPSLGAWPTKGVVPACASLDCVTVFSCNLVDALIVDQVVRGVHEFDPWTRSLQALTPEKPKKLLVPKEELVFFGPYADEYKTAWGKAVERMMKMDIPVEYLDSSMFAQAAAILYDGPWIAERWAALGDFVKKYPQSIHPVTEQVLRSAEEREYDAASVFQAIHQLQAYKLEVSKQLSDAVLVMPTSGGTWTREQVRRNPISTNSDMGRYTNHCNLLDLCAVAIPSDDAADGVPFGITMFSLAENEGLIFGAADLFIRQVDRFTKSVFGAVQGNKAATTLVAVCGLHMRGYPLEKQMLECGAHFVREARTAAKYQFIQLSTVPTKPGLIKKDQGGKSIELELWEMPLEKFGVFTASVPSPLGIGKVELEDGLEVPGFICEAYAAVGAKDITAIGGWRGI